LNKDFWHGKKIMVTGGAGFLGKHLVPLIRGAGAEIFVPRSKEYDLRKERDVESLFGDFSPEIVIHAAVHGGGIGHMKMHPGSIFYDNITMNTFMLEYSRLNKVSKFIGIGTVCSYPKFSPIPFREKNLWDGYPEETNAPYGLAKKMMLEQTKAYFSEYGFKSIHLLLVNMYGPYDDFDPEVSHVIPALIKKIKEAITANKDEIVMWGTGEPSREFLYAGDAARAIILAAEKYEKPEPVNVGAGFEIKIKKTVDIIAELMGYKGKIIWDASRPDGQPRRMLDVSKAEKEFGFKAETPFEEGLKKTIEWYMRK
jgi:GDP-L-fucose synthase